MISIEVREYTARLLFALQARGVPAERVTEVLAEVEAHVVESKENPTEAFGRPEDYARSIAEIPSAAPEPGRTVNWRDVWTFRWIALAITSVVGVTFFFTALSLWWHRGPELDEYDLGLAPELDNVAISAGNLAAMLVTGPVAVLAAASVFILQFPRVKRIPQLAFVLIGPVWCVLALVGFALPPVLLSDVVMTPSLVELLIFAAVAIVLSAGPLAARPGARPVPGAAPRGAETQPSAG